MEKLVFLNSNNLYEDPYTTSKIISEYGGVQHHTVTRLIQTYEKDLNEYGRVRFNIDTLQTRGGKQKTKTYRLNEQQATLLITYMQNTLPVRNFKKALVKQFFAMREELIKRRFIRLDGKKERNVLTEAIDRLPDTPHKNMLYKHYTDLVYKIAFNKDTKQLKKQLNVPVKGKLRDYLPAEELSKVKILEQKFATLIDFGCTYKEIKLKMQQKYLIN